MTDALPALCLLLVPGLAPLCRKASGRMLASFLMAYGMAIQCVGVYCDDDDWNRTPVSVDLQPSRVWDWSDWQVLRAARSGWKGPELLPLLREALSDPNPAHLEPLTVDDLNAELRVVRSPERLRARGRGEMQVAIRNLGTRSWPAFSGDIRVRYRVFLTVRWLVRGRPVTGVGEVLALPENVSPGEVVAMEVPLVPPPAPDSYQVELLVTQAMDGTHGVSGKGAVRVPVSVE